MMNSDYTEILESSQQTIRHNSNVHQPAEYSNIEVSYRYSNCLIYKVVGDLR